MTKKERAARNEKLNTLNTVLKMIDPTGFAKVTFDNTRMKEYRNRRFLFVSRAPVGIYASNFETLEELEVAVNKFAGFAA